MDRRPLRTAILIIILAAIPAGLADAGQTTGAPGPARSPVLRFDIAAGSLADVLTAFESVTGLKVQTTSTVAQLVSPGVTGLHTAHDALGLLIGGTGLTVRPLSPGTFLLEAGAAARRIEITGDLPRYVADESSTGTKTQTPLLDVPQTLTVVPRALMADQQAQSVADAVRNVPGVSVAQGEGNRDQVVLRGFSSASDFFVNGVRDDQERFRDLYNVQSVEVLQGPAAMLFGRGGAGGVINLVTARPTPGARSEATLEVGAYSHKRATAQVGGSLGSALSFRMSAMGESSKGFRDGFFLERHAVNPVAGIKLGARSDLTVSYEHLSDDRLADRGIPSQAGRPIDVVTSQLFGSRNQNDAESGVDSAGITFEHRVSSSVRVRNNFLAGRYDKFYRNVYPGSAVNAVGNLTLAAYDHGIDRTNVFNQTDVIVERRLGGMAHILLAGAEVGLQSQDELRHTAQSISGVALTDSVRDADFASAPVVLDRHANGTVLAGYMQDQIALAAHWKAVGGVRVDRFAVTVDDRLPANLDFSRTDVAASPRAGIIYQPRQSVAIYGSYSYTFLPSGQTLGLAANTTDLGPENAKNYEVGTKAEVLHRRLTLAAALFRLDRSNMKSVDPNDPTRLVLTGQQRTEGLTMTAAGRLGSRVELFAGYAQFDARITRTTTAAAAGHLPGLVPRRQGSLWLAGDVSTRLRLAGGFVAQTKTFTSFTNAVELPGFTRLDGAVFYRIKDVTVALNATNLTNARYYPTANGDNNISPGAPRSVQVAVRTIF